MKAQHHFFVNFVLMVIGIGVALVLVELTFRAFPEIVPEKVRVNPPVRRVKSNIDETYALRISDGDMFYWMQGTFPPLPQSEDAVISQVHMITDANGFRNLPPERKTYDIVAVGDSFTRGSVVTEPWPQRLAELTGYSVFNLADVGIGPQEEFNILRQYGMKKKPQWVILEYFEGNDLYDAAAYDQSNPFIFFRFGKYALDQGKDLWQGLLDQKVSRAVTPHYRYPIELRLNHIRQEMVFFSAYISWLSVDSQVLGISRNFQIVKEALLEAKELCTANNARLILVYIPTKEHIYLPLVTDPGAFEDIYRDVYTIMPDQSGFLQFTTVNSSQLITLQNMADQENGLTNFVLENRIEFLDLTPDFNHATVSGMQLYFTYDTHWNQAGQDLAADKIASYISR